MVRWIIFYSDGSSFSSEDGEPEEAPRTSVQAIAVVDIAVGHSVIGGCDFYCWEHDQWIPHNERGLMQYLALPGRDKIVLQGYHVPRELYGSIRSKAGKDPRLPPKTARYPSGHFALEDDDDSERR